MSLAAENSDGWGVAPRKITRSPAIQDPQRFTPLPKIGVSGQTLIIGARAQAQPRQVGIAFDGDPVGNLERKEEIRRHLGDELFEKSPVGELVVSCIHAYRLEHLR